MPIDDVGLNGDPVTAVPDQRRSRSDQRVIEMAAQFACDGGDTTPQNRNDGSNGFQDGPSGRARPTWTFDPPAFDPTTFDTGPDLPPLPTLRPLPMIRPLGRWPGEQQPRADAEPVLPPTAAIQAAAASATPPARHHRRVSGDAEQPSTVAPKHPPAATPSSSTEPAPAPLAGAGPGSGLGPDAGPGPGQRVLVLGGSGAIGSAVAAAMAAHGARVAVHHASHAVRGGELVAGLPGNGHLSVGVDLADSEAVVDLIRKVDQEFGGIDVVINAASAGDTVSRPSVLGSSLADWTDAWTEKLTIDVLGAATVAHAAAAAFVARGKGGRIILLAADGRASSGTPDPVGVATEQAVVALGSVLADELVPHGIGVIVVGSGSCAGSASSSGWSPTALAETVAWLAAGPAAGLPGAVIDIAG